MGRLLTEACVETFGGIPGALVRLVASSRRRELKLIFGDVFVILIWSPPHGGVS